MDAIKQFCADKLKNVPKPVDPTRCRNCDSKLKDLVKAPRRHQATGARICHRCYEYYADHKSDRPPEYEEKLRIRKERMEMRKKGLFVERCSAIASRKKREAILAAESREDRIAREGRRDLLFMQKAKQKERAKQKEKAKKRRIRKGVADEGDDSASGTEDRVVPKKRGRKPRQSSPPAPPKPALIYDPGLRCFRLREICEFDKEKNIRISQTPFDPPATPLLTSQESADSDGTLDEEIDEEVTKIPQPPQVQKQFRVPLLPQPRRRSPSPKPPRSVQVVPLIHRARISESPFDPPVSTLVGLNVNPQSNDVVEISQPAEPVFRIPVLPPVSRAINPVLQLAVPQNISDTITEDAVIPPRVSLTPFDPPATPFEPLASAFTPVNLNQQFDNAFGNNPLLPIPTIPIVLPFTANPQFALPNHIETADVIQPVSIITNPISKNLCEPPIFATPFDPPATPFGLAAATSISMNLNHSLIDATGLAQTNQISPELIMERLVSQTPFDPPATPFIAPVLEAQNLDFADIVNDRFISNTPFDPPASPFQFETASAPIAMNLNQPATPLVISDQGFANNLAIPSDSNINEMINLLNDRNVSQTPFNPPAFPIEVNRNHPNYHILQELNKGKLRNTRTEVKINVEKTDFGVRISQTPFNPPAIPLDPSISALISTLMSQRNTVSNSVIRIPQQPITPLAPQINPSSQFTVPIVINHQLLQEVSPERFPCESQRVLEFLNSRLDMNQVIEIIQHETSQFSFQPPAPLLNANSNEYLDDVIEINHEEQYDFLFKNSNREKKQKKAKKDKHKPPATNQLEYMDLDKQASNHGNPRARHEIDSNDYPKVNLHYFDYR